MPTIHANGIEIYYEETGQGAETIFFAHGLLLNCRMFDEQVKALQDRYRCVAFDFRGHGRSQVPSNGYDMDMLAEDAAALIQVLHGAPCHFAGLSMGGFVGLRLAVRYPSLLKSLTLLDTSADPEPEQNRARYRLMAFVARWFGLRLVAGQVIPIMFGKKFLADPRHAATVKEWKGRVLSNDRIGVTRAAQGVIRRAGVYDELGKITAPTLIVVGDQDVATEPAQSERMHDKIAGSQLVIIPGMGHISTIEEPELVNTTLKNFLSGL